MKVLVTGGAGFIGSHLVDKLSSNGEKVIVLDNLSTGKREFVNNKAEFIKFDLCSDPGQLAGIMEDTDFVWHIAANPEVKLSAEMPRLIYDNNILATFNLLEAMRKNGSKNIVFTSTSAVYGEAEIMPTPESYCESPVSVYGATKLSCEALIESYCQTYGLNCWIYRLANIIGPRSNHGVIPDFIKKLEENPKHLEILGDGKQKKSYLHIEDCVSAMIAGLKAKQKMNIFNIGNIDSIEVDEIAKIICQEMKIKPEISHTGGKTGWIGDVPVMLLSIDKIERMGWKPRYDSENAVGKTVKGLLNL